MRLRVVAVIGLLAFLAAPASAVWCAIACAFDDGHAAAADAMVAPPVANVVAALARGKDTSRNRQTVSSPDDQCGADIVNATAPAAPERTATMAVPMTVDVAASVASLTRLLGTSPSLARLITSSAGPPGTRPSSALRI